MRLGSDVAGVIRGRRSRISAPSPSPRARSTRPTNGRRRSPSATAPRARAARRIRAEPARSRCSPLSGAPLLLRYTTLDRWLDAAAEHFRATIWGEFEVEDSRSPTRRTLLAGYEAYLSAPAVQTCHGDSGGLDAPADRDLDSRSSRSSPAARCRARSRIPELRRRQRRRHRHVERARHAATARRESLIALCGQMDDQAHHRAAEPLADVRDCSSRSGRARRWPARRAATSS